MSTDVLPSATSRLIEDTTLWVVTQMTCGLPAESPVLVTTVAIKRSATDEPILFGNRHHPVDLTAWVAKGSAEFFAAPIFGLDEVENPGGMLVPGGRSIVIEKHHAWTARCAPGGVLMFAGPGTFGASWGNSLHHALRLPRP